MLVATRDTADLVFGERGKTHFFDIGSQQLALLTLGRAAAHLTDELIQLLLVEHLVALTLELISGSLGDGGLVHDAASNASAASVARTTGLDATHVLDGDGNLSCFLGKVFGNWQLRVGVDGGGTG